ncbi:MAG: response regulator transcription factor [Rhodospirillales bacterium]|nr:response regulator transcription factor [Rhodospirillales bacterium]
MAASRFTADTAGRPAQRCVLRASSRRHILVVDDDPKIRTLLLRCFEGEGFTVSEAKNGLELHAQLDRHPVSLITLDLNLGPESGLDLARQVRQQRNVSIVMLTGKGDAIDRVVGLKLGADDYLAKPFELRELLARVRAVLRRSEAATAAEPSRQRLDFEGRAFDFNRCELARRETGERVELMTSEFKLLEIFVKRPHQADPDDPHLIKTVRGVGYTFAVEIRRLE